MIYRTCITLGLTLVSLSLSSAEEKKSTDAAKKVTFEDDVKPIFRQHCNSCHNAGDAKGGLSLDSYTATIEGGGSGEIVFDDGDADGSRLWQLVNHDDTPVMPPKQDKLAAEKLAVIRAWIEGGILENSGSKAKAKKKNALAFVASTGGRPEGPPPMPESVPQNVPVVTQRASAITAIAASPWAPLIAIAGQKQIVLYHSDSSELLGVLPFDEGIAQSLRFSKNGQFLIAGGGEHSVKGIAAVYNIKTGQRVATVGDELDTVFDADANDTMNRIAMGGPLKLLRIFDATSGEQLFELKKHTDWIFTVAFSPDGILIATGDRSSGLCVWEAETGRLYLDLTGHKGAIHQVAWRDDSNVLASASEDGTVKLWDMAAGKLVKSFNAHGGGATSVAFDHQGRIVTAGKDNKAALWDGNGKKIRDFQPMKEDVLEVAIAHDGKHVVYGDWTGDVLSSSADDPKQFVSLAANPPPVSKRIEGAKTQLVSIQQEIQPLKASWDAAQKSVVAAQNPINNLNAKIAALRAESKKSSEAATATQNQIKAIDSELPGLTNASRDLHDVVIAARINLKTKPNDLESVAAAEAGLANSLTQLAQKRRARIASAKAVVAHQQASNAKKAEADKLAATLTPLQQKLAAVTQVAAAAKSKHDQVAAKMQAAKSKVDRLASAMK
ncbi:Chromosome partition protein Smc [Planctomycetes bacterium K23_9]|uniref:Chromosome partition protein Smc n=2 Tax=Stieleria marina TaxID=1930275 RepID=A0A517NRM2_9BACT|nr:Chromosome partition protein Smc [Planctomycetes bacterium K23_9]